MSRLTKFCGKHGKQIAWIFGKGPSLQKFPMEEAGDLRICINEAAIIVPNPTYFFSCDMSPIRRVGLKWPKGCLAFIPTSRAEIAYNAGIPVKDIIVFNKVQEEFILSKPIVECARVDSLYGHTGTLGSVIHFCCMIGVSAIVLVGCDGEGGYAECVNFDGSKGIFHKEIRDNAIQLMDKLSIPYEFWRKV